MTSPLPQAYRSFYGLGVAPKILEELDKLEFTVPTPIQYKAIPSAVSGKDVIGVAQTGTGKTLAFAIPIVQRLAQMRGRALILVPTRELAIQVDETFRKIAHLFGIQTVVLIGGASMHLQVQALRARPRIIVATPGRFADHMEQRTLMLVDINILVLDEADRMLDMGFKPQIDRILKEIPKERQTMLFSATIPQEILTIATHQMKLPLHIEIAPSGSMPERITQELYVVRKEDKKHLLEKILTEYRGSVLLFSRTKIGAMKITRHLRSCGHRVAEIHSNRSLSQRRESLDGFKAGKYRILVATDIAARGIDVTGIELVVNFDLPDDSENYVHRIGRTGRAGHEGHAISFATPEQKYEVRSIEKLIKIALPLVDHPQFPRQPFLENVPPPTSYQRHRGHSGGYRGSRGGGYGGGNRNHPRPYEKNSFSRHPHNPGHRENRPSSTHQAQPS